MFTDDHSWAQTTLREHWTDPRATLYTEHVLERGLTEDDLWNAAQLELVLQYTVQLTTLYSLLLYVNDDMY
jgi:hypothetical protein